MDTLPVFQPLLEEEERSACLRTLDVGWLGMGKSVGAFEAAIQSFVGARDRHVVALSTGHAALHLSLILAGVGPGDEVLTPSFNNIADFQAILAVGGAPVFVDIRDDTLCIDFDQAERLVGPRTKAVIVMDYGCGLADHDRAAVFARRHGLRVIHDAAHSFGSTYDGRRVGSFSDMTMFSFDPVKTITCIDGGVLIVRSDEDLARLRELRLIGMGQPATVMYENRRAWTYDVRSLGFRYHMANLHAEIGLAQLGKIERIVRSRREVCRQYLAQMTDLDGVRMPQVNLDTAVPFMFYLRVQAAARDALREHLRERGIDTGIHWQPGHWFTLLKGCRSGDLSVTERIAGEILTLPFHSMMAQESIDRVTSAVRSFFQGL
jgi:dTDP-4-amino-4,6-dideoxygalactose transaminase